MQALLQRCKPISESVFCLVSNAKLPIVEGHCSPAGAGCTDVDDALGLRWLADGRLEVGVHIADVSCFVKQVSATLLCIKAVIACL